MPEQISVLVAEDSVTVRAAIRTRLTGQGYRVVEADSGARALEAARREHPHVVLLDMEMPNLDSRQVLAAIEDDPDLAGTPVVFLASNANPHDLVACLEAGAYDYLRKPVDAPELVARIAAAARVKQLQDELRRRNDELDLLTRLDPLTGLYNRRHLNERLDALCKASRRHDFPVSVVLLDIDHFKRINDEHGHPAGDEVLRAMGQVLRAAVRAEDVPGRWGGEEFVLLLPYTEPPGTMMAAERTREALAVMTVPDPDHAGDTLPRITASVGLACARAADPDELVRRADAALYEAKTRGRNRVIVAPDSV